MHVLGLVHELMQILLSWHTGVRVCLSYGCSWTDHDLVMPNAFVLGLHPY